MSVIEQYSTWITFGIAIATLLGMVATYFRGVISQNKKIEDYHKDISERVHKLELQFNTMDTRFNVFWTVIEKELPKVLIRPHFPEIDALLIKMKHKGLTVSEKEELANKMRTVLEEDEDIGNVDSGLKLGYALLIARFVSERSSSIVNTTR